MFDTHLDLIFSLMGNDRDNKKQSKKLEALYNVSTSTQKKAIDNAMICLCGHSLDTIINHYGNLTVMDDDE